MPISKLDAWVAGIQASARAQGAFEVQLETPSPGNQPNERTVTDPAPDDSKSAAAKKRMKQRAKKQMKQQTKKRVKRQAKKQVKRRGPKPGTIDRYGKDDRALFEQMTKLIKDENLSPPRGRRAAMR